MAPFPFAESPARFSLLRRVLPKREWANGDFAREFRTTGVERVDIEIVE